MMDLDSTQILAIWECVRDLKQGGEDEQESALTADRIQEEVDCIMDNCVKKA